MAVLSSTLITASQRAVEDELGAITYTQTYEVKHDSPDDSPGLSIIGGRSSSPDAVPARGATYSQGGSTDLGSFAYDFVAEIPNDRNRSLRHVTVTFRKLEGGVTQARLQEPNPILWPIEYYIEWIEEPTVIKEAKNLQDLPGIGRPANTANPIVTAAGEEPTEPPMTTEFSPILVAVRNFATLNPIIALNDTYQNTVNANTFFGAPPKTARYLVTRSDRQRQVGTQVYYPTETRIAFRSKGWLYDLVNAGFYKIIQDGADKKPVAIEILKDDGSGSKVRTPSPIPLRLDGTTLSQPNDPGDPTETIIQYEYLEPVNYAGIGIGTSA